MLLKWHLHFSNRTRDFIASHGGKGKSVVELVFVFVSPINSIKNFHFSFNF